MKLHHPRTAAALTAILDRTGELFQGNTPEELVVLCRTLEDENAKLRELLQDVLYGADRRLPAHEGQSIDPVVLADIRAALAPKATT